MVFVAFELGSTRASKEGVTDAVRRLGGRALTSLLDIAMEWQKKRDEYEAVKARTKLGLSLCTICGAKNAKLCQGCGTTAYCSTDCQRIDWRDRGHRKACKKIRDERAAEAARAEAARAEAPAPPPSPPKPVFYGPAPRSHADEVRARIAAEHEAARVRREANPETEPLSARYGSRCPICLEEWDMNAMCGFRTCCCRTVCESCENKNGFGACPLCRLPHTNHAESLARLRRHVEDEVPEAMLFLGDLYRSGHRDFGIVKSVKKAAKIYKRAVELGNVEAMLRLGVAYQMGEGVKADKKKARRLWRMAGERGHCVALDNLGHSSTIEGDMEDAAHHYRLAADLGYAPAMYNLALRYLRGEGVEQDFEEAQRLLTRSAARGHEGATEALASIAQLGSEGLSQVVANAMDMI